MRLTEALDRVAELAERGTLYRTALQMIARGDLTDPVAFAKKVLKRWPA